jgi:hypothetical protein
VFSHAHKVVRHAHLKPLRFLANLDEGRLTGRRMACDVTQALLDDAINAERVFIVRHFVSDGFGIYHHARAVA